MYQLMKWTLRPAKNAYTSEMTESHNRYFSNILSDYYTVAVKHRDHSLHTLYFIEHHGRLVKGKETNRKNLIIKALMVSMLGYIVHERTRYQDYIIIDTDKNEGRYNMDDASTKLSEILDQRELNFTSLPQAREIILQQEVQVKCATNYCSNIHNSYICPQCKKLFCSACYELFTPLASDLQTIKICVSCSFSEWERRQNEQ